MPVRIPASELYKIQADHLRNALSEFREGVLPSTFNDSTRFDLLVDGYRRFPPKAIVALAARRALGRDLSSSEFAGGESSTVFRLLVERGFEFATKVMTVGEMDATFSVGRNKEAEFVLIESRGPERNTDYIRGLEALIRGLADLDASIEDIVVDSAVTRELPADQRRPALGHSYPIRLRAVSNLSALRLDIARAVAVTGRDPEAPRGGNSTKRLRLGFTEPDDLELFRIATFLAQNRGVPARRAPAFTFRPGAPTPGGGGTNTRRRWKRRTSRTSTTRCSNRFIARWWQRMGPTTCAARDRRPPGVLRMSSCACRTAMSCSR
jgi:hypothetical protein